MSRKKSKIVTALWTQIATYIHKTSLQAHYNFRVNSYQIFAGRLVLKIRIHCFSEETKRTLAKILDLLRSQPPREPPVGKLEYLPIKSAEDFEYLNDHILQDPELRNELVSFLKKFFFAANKVQFLLFHRRIT
jgi:hypothetical protein